jgi:hypothetical protein
MLARLLKAFKYNYIFVLLINIKYNYVIYGETHFRGLNRRHRSSARGFKLTYATAQPAIGKPPAQSGFIFDRNGAKSGPFGLGMKRKAQAIFSQKLF